MIKKRKIEEELSQTAKEYPVITIIGPRQSGKTTLAKKFFKKHLYVNLEDPEKRLLAKSDPKTFLKRFPAPVIYDEIQNIPELLSWIQVLVDERPGGKAMYILTGSHQPALNATITQSLAGRTALITLFPFSLNELNRKYVQSEREVLVHNGFLPRLHHQNIRPGRLYRDYYRTYVERDVRSLLAVENQQAFELFIRLLAARVGQEINHAALSNQIGMSAPQVKKWLSVLEASFIIFKVPPFFNNFGKRLTKSPKIYFAEVGLAAYLLGLEKPDQIERDPAFGGLFENMVMADLYKTRLNLGKEPRLYFYRDRYQNEIDALYPKGGEYIPIEIKSSRTFQADYIKGIRHYQKISGSPTPGLLIYDGDLEPETESLTTLNFRNVSNWLDQL
jgi:predicted AAA+ superfamily ATPase